ncbi:MAG: SPFH domain-containing protein [Clostridiales bacterium]|nr:SPFH domain-containing protein [Clostridiales bacterium]
MGYLIPVLIIVVALVVIVGAISTTWKKVPSDKAGVVVGVGRPKVVTGGGCIVIPVFQRMDTITLENIMFQVEIRQTKTKLGVPINADGIVVLKVKNTNETILAAVQQFNCANEGETVMMIRTQASEVCKGKLREIVSSMSVEDIYDNRESFAAKVQEVAGKELEEMGLELKSFTINDITDEEGYIEALGKEQIAKVKSEAAIAEAEAEKNRQIKTAEALKLGKTAQLDAEAQIAEAEKEKELKVLAFMEEQETRRARSDAAYQIQENITSKDVKNTSMDAIVLEKKRQQEVAEAQVQIEIQSEQKNIELAQRKADRKQAELQETVIRPAEAEKEKRRLAAEADRFEQVQRAEAEAEKLRLEGEARAKVQAEVITQEGAARAKVIEATGIAEADAIRRKGLAEAEALEKKAEALAKMNEAGKLEMVIDKYPEIVAAAAEPLRNIGKITYVGGVGGEGAGVAGEVAGYTAGILKAVTEVMNETLGFDFVDVMKAGTYDAKVNKKLQIDVSGLPAGAASAAITPEAVPTGTALSGTVLPEAAGGGQ